MRILVTGFEPFGQDEVNPSLELLKKLPSQILKADIIKLEVPVVRWKAVEKIQEAIKEYSPDVVLSVGQIAGRADVSVERVAINIDDYFMPDNEGNQPIDEPIMKDGPSAYFMTIPIKAIFQKLIDNKMPANISNSMGTYICNHVAYAVANIASQCENIKTGFIHVPILPEQAIGKPRTPSMSLETSTRAIELVIEAIVENATGAI
ncbi:MAG: pyroglutamyl-peptidase I [Treponema sp.]